MYRCRASDDARALVLTLADADVDLPVSQDPGGA